MATVKRSVVHTVHARSVHAISRRDRRLPEAHRPPAGLRRRARLPGGWLENGDAFDEWSHAGWRTNGGVGLVMDTLVGPVVLAGSWSFDGRWRTYLGIGRVFR